MKKTHEKLPEIKLVGITIRTNNKNEMDPTQAKIGTTIQKYLQSKLADKIHSRKNPGRTFCVFTDYESDFTGDYTYFIGEEVKIFENISEELTTLTIQPQPYAKFTTEPGTMPHVIIQAWQKIWQMTPDDFEGTRRYHADFEIYNERAVDPQNTVADLYIGLQ